MSDDPRIVFGAHCVWWDNIDKASKVSDAVPIPCCPHCRNVLYEVRDIKLWNESVYNYEKKGAAGYRDFMEWCRGKCFKTVGDAKTAYEAEGGTVTIINGPSP